LTGFVQHVLEGSVRLHHAATEPPFALGRHDPGPQLWTTHPHYLAEREQLEATAAQQDWQLRHDQQQSSRRRQQDDHLTAIANLQARQKALTPAATELVGREARGYVGVRDPDVRWAMGVPLFVHDQAQAVICPVAGRVSGAVRARLGELTLIVASDTERDRLATVCVPGQRIEIFEVEVPAVSLTVPDGVSVRQAVNTMFGRHR
jgi:competence protein CoiA